MDHAVALVQAYLQLNGYFTSAESPIVANGGRAGVRTITDIDILAFRFLSGLPTSEPRHAAQGLGVDIGTIDMIIGEVKEGRVGINSGIRDPDVLKSVARRMGDSADDAGNIVDALLNTGKAMLPTGYVVRLIAFGAFPPGSQVPPCRIISLRHVLRFLQDYVRRHWGVLRHMQFKDPALGFLMTLEKAKRGEAGRRGEEGVEVVPALGEQRAVRERAEVLRNPPQPGNEGRNGRGKR